jgi:hypothetical protein
LTWTALPVHKERAAAWITVASIRGNSEMEYSPFLYLQQSTGRLVSNSAPGR